MTSFRAVRFGAHLTSRLLIYFAVALNAAKAIHRGAIEWWQLSLNTSDCSAVSSIEPKAGIIVTITASAEIERAAAADCSSRRCLSMLMIIIVLSQFSLRHTIRRELIFCVCGDSLNQTKPKRTTKTIDGWMGENGQEANFILSSRLRRRRRRRRRIGIDDEGIGRRTSELEA